MLSFSEGQGSELECNTEQQMVLFGRFVKLPNENKKAIISLRDRESVLSQILGFFGRTLPHSWKIMDKIIIHDLEVRMRVGTIEAERNWPQRLLATIELEHDMTQAMQTDDLHFAIDYEKVVNRLREWGAKKQWNLLESMASDIADMVLEEFNPLAVSVLLKKFELPMTTGVSVYIDRRQKPLKKRNL
jgi:dihydroneopterin aldolase